MIGDFSQLPPVADVKDGIRYENTRHFTTWSFRNVRRRTRDENLFNEDSQVEVRVPGYTAFSATAATSCLRGLAVLLSSQR